MSADEAVPVPAELSRDEPDELPTLPQQEPASPPPASTGNETPADQLLSLNEAIERVPAALREEMSEQLRAQFREVRRWDPADKA